MTSIASITFLLLGEFGHKFNCFIFQSSFLTPYPVESRSIPYRFVGFRTLSDALLMGSCGFSSTSHFVVALLGQVAFSGFCAFPVFSSGAPLCSRFFLLISSSVLLAVMFTKRLRGASLLPRCSSRMLLSQTAGLFSSGSFLALSCTQCCPNLMWSRFLLFSSFCLFC